MRTIMAVARKLGLCGSGEESRPAASPDHEDVVAFVLSQVDPHGWFGVEPKESVARAARCMAKAGIPKEEIAVIVVAMVDVGRVEPPF